MLLPKPMTNPAEHLWVVASVGANVIAWARREGVDIPRLLDAAELSPTIFDDGKRRIRASAMVALWRTLTVEIRDEAFALRSGSAASVGVLPVVGPRMAASRTLAEALRAQVEYSRVLTNTHESWVDESAERISVNFRWHEGLPWPDNIFESAAAFNVAFVEQHVRVPIRLAHVRFPFEEPSHGAEHIEFFGCPVEYGAGHLGIVWDRSADRAELWTHAPVVAEALARLLAADDAASTTPPTTLTRLQRVFSTTPKPASLSLSRVASILGTTKRTLQRRLEQEGVTFRAVLDGYLSSSALRGLTGTASIEELADELGFSSRSAFHRAFVRWTNKTPAMWRSEQG